MDSRADEMERQITMKASSISILHIHKRMVKKEGVPAAIEETQHIINLIDSPGHVDFSMEVNAAVSLSDGALIVIDVVEGVSPQTLTVLRQAWQAKIKTCLVLNKLDRLIMERMMEPEEIQVHLAATIAQINGFIAELIQNDRIKKREGEDYD